MPRQNIVPIRSESDTTTRIRYVNWNCFWNCFCYYKLLLSIRK